MSLAIRDGFLVETFPRSGRVHRRARLLPQAPEGTVKRDAPVTVDGCQYEVAFHFVPGVRQGRAVAWPKEGV
jgi:hypothetical protein